MATCIATGSEEPSRPNTGARRHLQHVFVVTIRSGGAREDGSCFSNPLGSDAMASLIMTAGDDTITGTDAGDTLGRDGVGGGTDIIYGGWGLDRFYILEGTEHVTVERGTTSWACWVTSRAEYSMAATASTS